MKKLLSVILVVVMFASLFSFNVFADSSIKVAIDGVNQTYDVMPVIDNGRTLVPMRAIFEALGATVSWDDATKTMYIPYSKRNETWYATGDSSYTFENVSGILAVKVNENSKTLEKSENYTNVSDDYSMNLGFERTTYIGNVVFGYSDAGNLIVSFDKATQKQLDIFNIG